MVALSHGVNQRSWAPTYLEVRTQAELFAFEDNTLQPGCGPEFKFVPNTQMRTDALTFALREILVKYKVPTKDIHRALHEGHYALVVR